IAPHRAQHARWGPRSALVAPLRRGPHGADCAPWGGKSGRIAALGATPDFHRGLPALSMSVERRLGLCVASCLAIRYRLLRGLGGLCVLPWGGRVRQKAFLRGLRG